MADMEFIVMFITEMVLGTATETATSAKTAKRVRIVVTALLTLFYIAFLGLFVYMCIESDELVIKGITVFLALLFTYVFVRLWRKVLKGEPLNEWEE
ncbi:MAG: hypothetical protein IJB96_12880 [Lachnospira sp.]|nr:hypothetical protein [Lachnospira sp.]